MGVFWFLSIKGFTSSEESGSGVSFLSASRLPAARAATSFSKAADEVMETRERKELAGLWCSTAVLLGCCCCCCWLRSDTFLDSAASVELADCELNGEVKASKRTTSSEPRGPSAGIEVDEVTDEEDEDDEDEEEEEDKEDTEATAALLSCNTALAAAFSFWIAESGDKLLPLAPEQLEGGGHLSATPTQTKPLFVVTELPLVPLLGMKGSLLDSCLMVTGTGEAEADAEFALLPLLFARRRARALSCWAWWDDGDRARPTGGESVAPLTAPPPPVGPNSPPSSSFREPDSRRRRKLLLRGFPNVWVAESP